MVVVQATEAAAAATVVDAVAFAKAAGAGSVVDMVGN